LRSVTRKRAPMLHLMRQTRLRFNTGAGLIHKFDVARLCDRLIYRLENFDFSNVRIQKAWALFLSIDSKLVKLERQLNLIDELVNMVPGIVEKVDLNCEGTKSAAADA